MVLQVAPGAAAQGNHLAMDQGQSYLPDGTDLVETLSLTGVGPLLFALESGW